MGLASKEGRTDLFVTSEGNSITRLLSSPQGLCDSSHTETHIHPQITHLAEETRLFLQHRHFNNFYMYQDDLISNCRYSKNTSKIGEPLKRHGEGKKYEMREKMFGQCFWVLSQFFWGECKTFASERRNIGVGKVFKINFHYNYRKEKWSKH